MTTDLAGSHDRAYAVTLRADGKIVVAGYAHLGPTSFDDDGRVTTSFLTTGAKDYAYDVAVQADGKIVAAGYTVAYGCIYDARQTAGCVRRRTLLSHVRQAWCESWRWKSSVDRNDRNHEPKARVPVARRDLNEAGGETRCPYRKLHPVRHGC